MSFFTKFFLYFLPLVSIPVIIHLLGKNRIKTVRFSSLKFLEQLKNDTIKKLKLRQIILLIIRTLLLLLIILFFARPYITFSDADNLPEQGETLFICIDNSHSMSENFQDRSLMQNSIEDLNSLAKNITFPIIMNVVTTTTPNNILEIGIIKNIEEFQKSLNKVPNTNSQSFLNKALSTIQNFITEKEILQSNLWIISDFQTEENLQLGLDVNLTELVKKQNVSITIFPIAHSENNRAISEVVFPKQILEINKSVLLEAKAQFWQEKIKTTLSLFIENERVAQGVLNTDDRSVEFEFLPLKTGILTGTISITEDALPQDDKYYFALNIPQKINVLLVSNSPKEMKHLQQAIMTGKESLIHLQTITPQILSMENLSDYDLLIFHGIVGLYDSFANRLKDYTEEGKSILYIPTISGNADEYNEFWNKKIGFPKWQSTISGSENNYIKIKDINRSHGIFENIWQDKDSFQSSSHFYSIPVFLNKKDFEILMTYSNNYPMMLESENKILLANFLETGSSDFRLSGLFPILMQQTVQYLTNSSGLTDLYNIGDTLSFRNFSIEDIKNFTMKTPGNQSFIMDYNKTNNLLHFAETTMPGFYRLFYKDQNIFTYAVNINKSEASEQFFTQNEITKLIENKENIAMISNNDSEDKFKINKELNSIFLFFILLLLIAETIIARINHDSKRNK
jgi:hypothetical protein